MKIVCPECQAAYDIDIPESPSKDLSAKCAVCNSKFPIIKATLEKASHTHDSMTGPPLAQIDSGQALESTDDFLSGLHEDQQNIGELHLGSEEPLDDKNLDDYLDQLFEEEFVESGKEVVDEPAQPPSTESTSLNFETPTEDDLDRLFDSLIAEEIKPEIVEENTEAPNLSPEIDRESENLDALLDEIMRNNLDEEEEVEPKAEFDETEATLKDSEPLTTKKVEIDEPVSSPISNAEQEIEIPEPENLSPETGTTEISDKENLLEEAPPEEKTLNKEDQSENSKETDLQETTEAGPSDDQQEENKSDEDLWAEAFADQEALKETGDDSEKKSEESSENVDSNIKKDVEETAEAEPSTDQQEEDKSDEDLWAEAFADQEAVEETAEEKQPDEKKEEDKSDEDLWAEAFADQEALKETPDDSEKKTEEPTESADQNQEEGAEETVEAEAEMDSAEETSSEEEEDDSPAEANLDEEDDSEEEPERNEFGISEADYEDDDDEVGDQYDEYGEDEEESSSPEKKKFAFLSLPSTKTGKLVLGGGILAVLLTGGGAYFAMQTLAPPELTEMTKKTSVVPEGLTPKDSQESPASQNQSGNTPAEKPNPALTAALGNGATPPPVKDTGNHSIPLPAKSSSGASKGLMAALAPSNNAVQLGTIMPVAYNINDIRVLSFSLEAEMSDAESAQVIREALPVFEKITISTVEQLMDKKFFNDILYVKEKLKKSLQNNFNKTLEGGGRVKKITFKDFTVQ